MVPTLKFSPITLFPEMFDAIKNEGIIARAINNNLLSIEPVFLRQFSDNNRKNVDDTPFGGSDGMLIRADIMDKAIQNTITTKSKIILLSPTGKIFNNNYAKELTAEEHIIFLCGRYAGIDHRIIQKYNPTVLSIGDFVLSGGELACMCLIDSISRFISGVLGNSESSINDSFEDGLLEPPLYTKPITFDNFNVPNILLSGNHKEISTFNRKQQVVLTAQNRPDIIFDYWDKLNNYEKNLAKKVWKHQNI